MKVSFSRGSMEESMIYLMGYQVGLHLRKYIQKYDSHDFYFSYVEMKSIHGLVDVILSFDGLMTKPIGRAEL